MKLMYEGTRIKELRVTGNLNDINTRTKMANLAPQLVFILGSSMVKKLNGFLLT